jgi:hypothetical protein
LVAHFLLILECGVNKIFRDRPNGREAVEETAKPALRSSYRESSLGTPDDGVGRPSSLKATTHHTLLPPSAP